MSCVPPTNTPEEIIASLKSKAAHWRREAEVAAAENQPEAAAACLDYAQHIETLIELERLKMLD